MAKRIRLKDVEYVKLEIKPWLLEWGKNPDWTAQDFGIYWLICLRMYEGGGKITSDPDKLAAFCRTSRESFDDSWERIQSKLKEKGATLFQKRVRKELREARTRIQSAVNAGVKGAKKRWRSYGDPVANENETKSNTNISLKPSNSKARARSLTTSLRFVHSLKETITARNTSDSMAYRNLDRWLATEIANGRFTEEIYSQILDIAKDSKRGRNPIAVLFSRLDKEVGYRPRAAKDKFSEGKG